jgi:hypothetical protein
MIPLEKVQAQLNIDMVGRDDCNDIEGDYSNSLFVIGADRISTDSAQPDCLHQLHRSKATGARLRDERSQRSGERVYAKRSLQYASKGIPMRSSPPACTRTITA